MMTIMALAGNDGKPGENSTVKKKSPKVKIISATFCIYDIVTKRDIRIEICFPGSTNVIALNEHGERSPLGSHDWNNVFVSSQLRSFHKTHCYVARTVPQFSTDATF